MKTLHFKIIYMMLILVVSINCNLKSKAIRETRYYYITNTTNKSILHQLTLKEDIIGNKTYSIFIKTPCVDSFEWSFSINTGTIYHHRPINFGNEYIYNLTDTMSLILLPYNEFSSKIFSLFYKYQNEIEETTQERHVITKSYLQIDESLLSFMQKDTTMLTKFKDYYK